MSQRERCHWCRQPIMGTAIYVARYTAATRESPAEVEHLPMHRVCADKATSLDYAEWVKDERADRRRDEREGR